MPAERGRKREEAKSKFPLADFSLQNYTPKVLGEEGEEDRSAIFNLGDGFSTHFLPRHNMMNH